MSEASAIGDEIRASSEHLRLEDRLVGTLLGTALGDALGLPAEGMSARAIRQRFGSAALPGDFIDRIHDGPFGPSHLHSLGQVLARVHEGQAAAVPRYSRSAAVIRNLALYPVIIGHGLWRLLPP